MTLSRLGRDEEAIIQFEKALTLKPDFAAAHYQCGLALAKLERHEVAIGHYRRAVALDPCSAAAYNDLAMSLTKLGRHQEAVAALERALALLPGSDPAKQNSGCRVEEFRPLCGPWPAARGGNRIRTCAVGAAWVHAGLSGARRCAELFRPAARSYCCLRKSPGRRSGRGDGLFGYRKRQDVRRPIRGRARGIRACSIPVAQIGRVSSLSGGSRAIYAGRLRLAALEALARDEDSVPEKEWPDLYLRWPGPMTNCSATRLRSLASRRPTTSSAIRSYMTKHGGWANCTQSRSVHARVFGCTWWVRRPLGCADFYRRHAALGTTLVEQILASHPQVFGAGEQ